MRPGEIIVEIVNRNMHEFGSVEALRVIKEPEVDKVGWVDPVGPRSLADEPVSETVDLGVAHGGRVASDDALAVIPLHLARRLAWELRVEGVVVALQVAACKQTLSSA